MLRPARGECARDALPLSSVAEHTVGERQFLQARIAMFAAVMFALFGLVFVAAVVGISATGAELPRGSAWLQLMAGTGVAALGIVWFLARRLSARTLAHLYALDAVMVIMVGVAMGLAPFIEGPQMVHLLSNSFFCTFFVIGRALFVPSSGLRTAAVSAAAFAPLCLGSIVASSRHPGPGVSALDAGGVTIFLAAITVALASAGSRVIYGLRRDVREAQQLGQYTLGEKLGEGGMVLDPRCMKAAGMRDGAAAVRHH